MSIPRRTILGLAVGAGFLSRLVARPVPCQRRYRAHATITLLSIPIVSKSDVGSGYILIEEDSRTTAIQFGAGSWPESARGLNRLGFIREEVTGKSPGEPAECAYFAFMTTSQEKSLDQAKKALETTGDTIPYAAAEGLGRDGRFVSRLNRISFPSQLTWRDCPQLIDKVRSAVAAGVPAQRVEKTLGANESAPATFLYAVHKAILDPDATTSGSLIYNGKEFQLRTTKEDDAAAGAHFVARGLVRESSRVIRLNALLHDCATGHETPFKVWYEVGAEHLPPLRFEYQAKPFLRLTFEFDPAAAGPPVSLVLNDLARNDKEIL